MANPSQKTGRQVNLPLPNNCGVEPALSACSDTFLLNQLDGFSVNPRITVCFDGPVDSGTLRTGIRLQSLNRFEPAIAINQIVYDPNTYCVFAKPDRVLDQQSRYLLTVMASVRDSAGAPVKEDDLFLDCLKKDTSTYCRALSNAVDRLPRSDGKVVGASLFTTLSTTDWLQKARILTTSAQTPAAVLPAGATSIFNLAALNSITWIPQTNNPALPPGQDIPLGVLGGVEKIAFGLYLSPNFINVSGPLAGSISVTPTNNPIAGPVAVPGLPPAIPPGLVPVSFHAFLPPASQMPSGGFPVVVYGHGMGDSQFGAPTFAASTWAQNGFATLAIEIPGHGFGPGGVVQLSTPTGVETVATPGRGIQFSPTGPIGPSDGCILPGPLAVRDCARQTAVDLMALVRTIQATGGLGLQLNPARIYYVGQSFGSIYGTLFHAVEPAVKAAALNVPGGTSVDISRISPIGRQVGTFYLQTHNPPLLNVPPAPADPIFNDLFNDNYPFRNRPVLANPVPGALDIQDAFEVADWLGMLGDSLGYARHLKTAPLPGVPAKSTLFQFALGDLEVPNPANSALIRAAGGQNSSWYLRFDRAVQTHPELLGILDPSGSFPILPHRFLSNPTIFLPQLAAENSLAMAAQKQIAGYFVGGGQTIPDPNPFLTGPFSGMTLFEIPTTLPEQLNFLVGP
ncbi:MAG: Ig-like domain-containing protein [Bryobacteraceae bacterium]